MFSMPAFTCNFWGAWESRTRLSPLPENILLMPATATEQKMRVQREVLKHRVAWGKFWMHWWRKLAPVEETTSASGWETHSASGSESDGYSNNRVQLPNPRELGQRIGVPESPPPEARLPPHPCACGERACNRFPDCISSLADLLSPRAAKRPRGE